MAFRSACQRLRLGLVHLPQVSRINRGLPQGTEQSRHVFRSQKQVASSSGTLLHGNSPAPCRSISEKLYRCEPCRNLSTISPSEVEEREELSDATSRSQEEAVLSQAPGDSNGSSEMTSSPNISVESAYVSSPRHDLALLFTCTVCDTRSAKTMSRSSYETGVVIIRCPGCKKLHLIADRYGWFGEKGGVEDFLAEKGIDVRTGSDSTYEFTVEDLTGWTRREEPEKV